MPRKPKPDPQQPKQAPKREPRAHPLMPVPVEREKSSAERTAEIIAGRKRLPLEVMLDTMDELYDAGNHIAAAAIARDIAPYCHARLKDITLGPNPNASLDFQKVLASLRFLGDEELATLEAAFLAALPAIDAETGE